MTRFDDLTAADFLKGASSAPSPGGRAFAEMVLNVVRSEPDGTRAKDIAEGLDGVSYQQVTNILQDLERDREVYSRTVGDVKLWYPNGRLVHQHLREFFDLNGTPFRLSFHEGRHGPELQIQEREFSVMEGERVKGAIFVEERALQGFIEALFEMKDRYEQQEYSEVER